MNNTIIVKEESTYDKIDQILDSIKSGKNVLLICGDTVRKISNKMIESSKKYNFSISNTDNIPEGKFDMCIGMGGGKSIDFAKFISSKMDIPWVSFPTALSNDGIFYSRTSFNFKKEKISIESKLPKAVIIDMEILLSSPYRLNASGAGDVISNISAIEDWKIAERAGKEEFNSTIARISESSVEKLKLNLDEIKQWTYEGVDALLKSLILSSTAMNSWKSSRPCSGSEHNINHSIKDSTLLHGENVALASIATTYLQGKNPDHIKELNKELKLPTKATKEMISAFHIAKDVRERYTVLNEFDINKSNIFDVLKSSGIF